MARCSRIAATVLFLVLAGCSGDLSLENVVLHELGDDDWDQVLDSPLTPELLQGINAIAGRQSSGRGTSPSDPAWIRTWLSAQGSVTIVLTEPGPLRQGALVEIQRELESDGHAVQGRFDEIANTIAVDLSDHEGPAAAVLASRESYLVSFLLEGDVLNSDTAPRLVRRQLDALPEYDPTDQYRTWMVGIFGVVFVLALWYAFRSLRAEPNTTPSNSEGFPGP